MTLPDPIREALAREAAPDAFRDADASRAMLATLPGRRLINLDGPALRRVAEAYALVDRLTASLRLMGHMS